MYREGLKKREPHETALLTEDEAVRLESYTAYLEWEQQQGGDPVMLQQLHERAVGQHCLQDQLWLRYTTYLTTEIKIPEVSVMQWDKVYSSGSIVCVLSNNLHGYSALSSMIYHYPHLCSGVSAGVRARHPQRSLVRRGVVRLPSLS